MKDSYQKFADDMWGQASQNHKLFAQVKVEDLDEVRCMFAVQVAHLQYADNFRIYALEQSKRFYEQASKGCCGSWDSQYKCLSGNIYWVGCNFGH